jgi:ribosomal protein S18 acetylase RimI-like enzyme
MSLILRDLRRDESAWVRALLAAHWGGTTVVSRGNAWDATSLPGLVAERRGQRVGLATYRFAGNACELVTLDALERRQGIGRALLVGVAARSGARGCDRLWLVTSNENFEARGFYGACGLTQVAVHRGAVTAARVLKPSIPEFGPDGTRIEDEIEFELRL